jgi:uncharacterized protein involved in exopolysaccharide biosynthesis
MRQPESGQLDILKLLWRYKLLLIIGLAAGLGWGYYQHIQLPVNYISSASIQIVEPISNSLPIAGIDAGQKKRSLDDEVLVIRSEGMMRRAAELGQVASTPGFSGWNLDSVSISLANSVQITPAGKSSATSIFQISHQAGDPVTTQRVVQSVMDAYAEHLQTHYTSVGKETVDLIQTAKTDVLRRLEELEHEFDEFRQTSPLLFRGSQTSSIHRLNADNFLTQKQQLLVRKMQLETTLRVASDAIDSGEPIESILIAVSGGNSNAVTASGTAGVEEITAARLKQIEKEVSQSPSERVREQRLLPLEVNYRDLLDRFGSGHPAVKTAKSQLDLVSLTVERMAKAEEAFDGAHEQTAVAAT